MMDFLTNYFTSHFIMKKQVAKRTFSKPCDVFMKFNLRTLACIRVYGIVRVLTTAVTILCNAIFNKLLDIVEF